MADQRETDPENLLTVMIVSAIREVDHMGFTEDRLFRQILMEVLLILMNLLAMDLALRTEVPGNPKEVQYMEAVAHLLVIAKVLAIKNIIQPLIMVLHHLFPLMERLERLLIKALLQPIIICLPRARIYLLGTKEPLVLHINN